MNPGGDYSSEMGNPMPLDDATAEALLAGRDVGHDLEQLRQVVLAYRDAARLPVPPRGELAVRMATGAFRPPDRRTAPPPRRPARSGGRAQPPHPAASPDSATTLGTRLRAAVMPRLTTTAAKLAGLSVIAKAAAGVTVATAGITTAGASGVLPDPAQAQFDSVVETVTGGDESPAPGGPGNDPEPGKDGGIDGEDGGIDGGESSEEPGQRPDEPADLPAPDEEPTAPVGPPTAVPEPGATPPVGLPTAVPEPGANAATAPPGR